MSSREFSSRASRPFASAPGKPEERFAFPRVLGYSWACGRVPLNDPVFQTSRFAAVPAAVQQLTAANAAAARLYQHWEELETLRELTEGNG
jgi:hypothetical protein